MATARRSLPTGPRAATAPQAPPRAAHPTLQRHRCRTEASRETREPQTISAHLAAAGPPARRATRRHLGNWACKWQKVGFRFVDTEILKLAWGVFFSFFFFPFSFSKNRPVGTSSSIGWDLLWVGVGFGVRVGVLNFFTSLYVCFDKRVSRVVNVVFFLLFSLLFFFFVLLF